MVDINSNINQSIKKQLKAQVSTQQNKAETKTSNTEQTSVVAKSTTKLSASEIQLKIEEGDLSAKEAVKKLQSDLNAKVKTTQLGTKIVASANVDGKVITIVTTAKDVPVVETSKTIPTAKTINPKVALTENKSLTNDSGNVNATNTNSSQTPGVRKAQSENGDEKGDNNGDSGDNGGKFDGKIPGNFGSRIDIGNISPKIDVGDWKKGKNEWNPEKDNFLDIVDRDLGKQHGEIYKDVSVSFDSGINIPVIGNLPLIPIIGTTKTILGALGVDVGKLKNLPFDFSIGKMYVTDHTSQYFYQKLDLTIDEIKKRDGDPESQTKTGWTLNFSMNINQTDKKRPKTDKILDQYDTLPMKRDPNPTGGGGVGLSGYGSIPNGGYTPPTNSGNNPTNTGDVPSPTNNGGYIPPTNSGNNPTNPSDPAVQPGSEQPTNPTNPTDSTTPDVNKPNETANDSQDNKNKLDDVSLNDFKQTSTDTHTDNYETDGIVKSTTTTTDTYTNGSDTITVTTVTDNNTGETTITATYTDAETGTTYEIDSQTGEIIDSSGNKVGNIDSGNPTHLDPTNMGFDTESPTLSTENLILRDGQIRNSVTTTDSNGDTVIIWVDDDGKSHTEYPNGKKTDGKITSSTTTVKNPDGSISQTIINYDSNGNATSKTETETYPGSNDVKSSTYYDYENGTVATYNYDGDGNIFSSSYYNTKTGVTTYYNSFGQATGQSFDWGKNSAVTSHLLDAYENDFSSGGGGMLPDLIKSFMDLFPELGKQMLLQQNGYYINELGEVTLADWTSEILMQKGRFPEQYGADW